MIERRYEKKHSRVDVEWRGRGRDEESKRERERIEVRYVSVVRYKERLRE